MIHGLQQGTLGCIPLMKHLSRLTYDEGDKILKFRYFLNGGDCLVKLGKRDEAQEVMVMFMRISV